MKVPKIAKVSKKGLVKAYRQVFSDMTSTKHIMLHKPQKQEVLTGFIARKKMLIDESLNFDRIV